MKLHTVLNCAVSDHQSLVIQSPDRTEHLHALTHETVLFCDNNTQLTLALSEHQTVLYVVERLTFLLHQAEKRKSENYSIEEPLGLTGYTIANGMDYFFCSSRTTSAWIYPHKETIHLEISPLLKNAAEQKIESTTAFQPLHLITLSETVINCLLTECTKIQEIIYHQERQELLNNS